MSLDVLSTLEHDPDVGEGTILFGGSGFIGPYILANYPKIISVGRSPCPTPNRHIHVDSLADLSALEGLEFDKVIYLIGNSNNHRMVQEVIPPGGPSAFDYNTIPVIQVLEQLKTRKLKKFIHLSSVLIYDEKITAMPVSEESPIDPYRNRYVMSRYLGEELLKFYRNWLPIINVRISNTYGPTRLERYNLINVLARKLASERRAEIWTTVPSRDFLYVEDAAHAIADLLHADYNDTVLLGSGEATSIADVVEILRNITGLPIISLDKPVSGPMRFQADISRLQSLIEWAPRVGLEEGIRRTWNFELPRKAA